MRRKPIDKLYGLPAILILVLLLAKYLELFTVPNWLLGGAVILCAVAFFVEGMKQRKKKS
jgi:general stress protein CsbA